MMHRAFKQNACDCPVPKCPECDSRWCLKLDYIEQFKCNYCGSYMGDAVKSDIERWENEGGK